MEALEIADQNRSSAFITCWPWRGCWMNRPLPPRLASCASPDERCLSSHANHPERGRSHIALPDGSVIELDRHAVGRIDGAHVPVIGPDLGRRRSRIGPGTGRLTGFVDEIYIRSVLRNQGGAAERSRLTPF